MLLEHRFAYRLVYGFMVAVGVSALAQVWEPIRVAAQQPTVSRVGDRIGNAGEDLTVVHISDQTGFVTFASAQEESAGPRIPGAVTQDTSDRAFAFLQQSGSSFGITNVSQLTLLSRQAADGTGVEHFRYGQGHQGVPVTAGEIAVHIRGERVVAVNGEIVAGLAGISTSPTLLPSEALLRAQQFLARDRPDRSVGASLSAPRLELFNRGVLDDRPHPTRLAWFIEATGPFLREYIWVDALNSTVLLSFSQLTDAKSRQVYDATSTATLPGTLKRSEGEAAIGDADVDNAYDFGGDTYDYFFATHGRDSFDGTGAAIIQTVDYCPSPGSCPYANAFWNGSQMVYGDGYASADDVVGHELVHALTENSADLFYYMQSGALNESFSDIFGEAVDLGNAAGTDTAVVRWEMGEDLPIGAIRNMSDPTLFGHPGKLSDAVQFVCNQNFDAGGVHINSGVPNHAFALVVDGGNYNGVNVAGIGLVKAAKVQYRALTTYLTSGANFVDDVNALNQSCTDLIGTSGITTTDCNQVALALQAVEMSATWPCTGATVPPPLCSADMTASTIFSDGFEAGGGNWTVSSTGIGAWTFSKGWASDGLWSSRGSDPASVSDHNLTQTAAVILPANARLQFDHAFGFETSSSFWDGAVLEYSTNGGGTWVDAGSAELITAGQAYGGTISGTLSEFNANPLAGRAGFVGRSYGYTATQLDLSSLTGMSVKFRFRIGTDSSNLSYPHDTRGWAVDDFIIYACVSNPTLTVIGTGTGTGTVTSSGVSCTSTAGVTSGDCVESASPGTVFALSGVASTGSTFAGFTGDADCTDASVTLTADTTCTADFTLNQLPPFTLTVTGTGTGTGTVTGTGISCTSTAGVTSGDCADGPVASGTLFAVTASPSAGSTFGTWGGCDSTAANVCNVTLTADRTVTATFGGMSVPGTGVRDTHYLPLNLDGSGRSATIAYNAIAGGATVFGIVALTGSTPAIFGPPLVAHPWSSGWTIKPGDFNGDGRTDLLFYDAASGAVFKAISDGAFGFTYVGTSWSAGWDIAVMNLNGDGLDDVFLYNTATGQYFRGTSAGAGTGDFTYVGGAWSPNWQVHTAELNADGITDLFLYNVTQGTWFRALNDGANGFTYVSGSWSPEWQVYPADYTGDGLTDVVLYNVMTGVWFVARNTGTGWAYTGGTWSPGWTVRPGDFSGDGIIDLFLYNGVTGTYFVSVSDGAGGFAHSGATLSPGWQTFVTNFNLDVLADILFYNAGTGSYFQGITTTPGSFDFFGGTFGAGQTIITNRPILP